MIWALVFPLEAPMLLPTLPDKRSETIVTEPTLRYGTILVEKIGSIITKRAEKRHTDTVAHNN